MRYTVLSSFYGIAAVCCMLLFAPANKAAAQNNLLALSAEVSPALESAQVLSLTGLGIDEQGSGPVLLSGYLENLTDQTIDNLYFEVIIRSARRGAIVELTQRSGRPFSLEPYKSVYATNNDLANERIPGIEEPITFSGGLTTAGENLINNLEGSTSLPQDVYTIEITVFQLTNAQGRTELASTAVEVGTNDEVDGREIYLKTPGDVPGSDITITNPYPQFSWEGETNREYRLTVVADNGQDSPESLLQSAISSPPTNNGGSLLQYEHLDVFVNSNTYQYPSSGAQALQEGERYFWRVSTTLQLTGDTEQIQSEIWEFALTSSSSSGTVQLNPQAEQAIIALIGQERYEQLTQQGFTLEAIQYDGQQYSGSSATLQLEEILRKIEDEELIIGQ